MVSRPVYLGVGLPFGAHDQIFVFCLTIAGFLMRAPSLTRGWVCNLLVQLLLGLGLKSRRTHNHILLSHLRLPQLGAEQSYITSDGQSVSMSWCRAQSGPCWGQVHVFISPSNKVAQLYSQALCSFLVASYDSQGYDGFYPASTRVRARRANCNCTSIIASGQTL
jgi:hypothetical protein